MGADKAFVPLAGRPLIAHVLDRLEPQVESVLISANGDASRFAALGCRVVADAARQGPLSGVLSALQAAAGMGATHLVSTPVDKGMGREQVDGDDATGDHPATAIWPVGLAPALADFLAEGQAKVTRFTEAHHAARASFPDARAFLNLNTPEDLVAAEALLKGAA